MKIGFLSNKLTLRGTEITLYDYADCSEKILGHQSIIITRPRHVVERVSPRDVHPQAYEKFERRFKVDYYINPGDVVEIVKRNNLDVLFIEKAGSWEDGLVFNCCKTIIHCVFDTTKPHGTLYTSISDSLNKIMKTNIPVLPNMVRVHPTKENFRQEYGIPDDAIVFGSYSGADEYTMDHVKRVVCDVVQNPSFSNIYFIYLNIDRFGPNSDRLKFFPGTADMEYKRRFINTCDAMLYGRTGGETFGLSCGEFCISGKPVIAKPGERARAHEDLLGNAMIKCSTYSEVLDVVTNWNKYKRDTSGSPYFNYTEENVMGIFQDSLNKI